MDDYSDIINLPHHVSKNRKRMTNRERAAQFAPFAALTGLDAAINETGRITDRKILLSDEELFDINKKLNFIKDNLKKEIKITIEYFVPDSIKSGGKYLTNTDFVSKINEIEQFLTLRDGLKIPFENIYSIIICDKEDSIR